MLARAAPAQAHPTHLSFAQIETLWNELGGDPAQASTAAAVALAESGGQLTSENHNTDGSIDRGLFQINSVHGKQSTFDETKNVQAAIAIYNEGHSWAPWVTFKTGAYKKFLGEAHATAAESQAAAKNVKESKEKEYTGPLAPVAQAINEVGKVAEDIGEWLGDPLRVVKLIGGGVLLYMGLRTLTRTSAGATVAGETRHQLRSVTSVGGAVGKATPTGAAAKAGRKALKLKPKGGTS